MERKRGGQKGNHNARKHGFYSSSLTAEEISWYWNLTVTEGVDPETAIIRIKLQNFIQQQEVNSDVLEKAARLLVNVCRAKYKLNRTQAAGLRQVVLNLWLRQAGILTNSPPPPETNQF